MSLKLNDKNRETIKQVFNLKANKVQRYKLPQIEFPEQTFEII